MRKSVLHHPTPSAKSLIAAMAVLSVLIPVKYGVAVAEAGIAVVDTCSALPCRPELPIAVCGEDLACGREVPLLISDSNFANACWTGFFGNANGNNIRNYIQDCATIPVVATGDFITLNHGNIAGPAYHTLREELTEYQTAHNGSVDREGRAVCIGTGNVFVPDVENPGCNDDCGARTGETPVDINADGIVDTADCGMPRSIPIIPRSVCDSNCNQTGPVTGFALVVITQVKDTGNPKFVMGVPLCCVRFPGCL